MEIKRRSKRNTPSNAESKGLEAPKKLKILITIVERSKTDFYLDILEGYEVNMQTVMYGHGTAPSDIMTYLGIVQNDKVVIFSVVQEENIKEILAAYEDKYFKTKHGKGIAFTIPITSLIGVSIYQFLSNSADGRGE
jgi:nitrogen regulatory protein PII